MSFVPVLDFNRGMDNLAVVRQCCYLLDSRRDLWSPRTYDYSEGRFVSHPAITSDQTVKFNKPQADLSTTRCF